MRIWLFSGEPHRSARANRWSPRWRPERSEGKFAGPRALLELGPDQQAEDDRKQCRCFDERPQQQRARLNRSSDFLLSSDAFDGRDADASNADTGDDGGETGT